jgi:hypothetical protein
MEDGDSVSGVNNESGHTLWGSPTVGRARSI